MPATATPPAGARSDRHKKRHNVGLRPAVFELLEQAADASNRPTTWEVELAIAYYCEHALGMAIPEGVRRLTRSHGGD